MKKRSLLLDFINKKINEYVEPQRKGTPKGEPIGLSKKKYAVSLWTLSDMTQKEIASKNGVSHGLILKWRTEPTFRKSISQNSMEFCRLIIDTLVERYKKFRELDEDRPREKKEALLEWIDCADEIKVVSKKEVLPHIIGLMGTDMLLAKKKNDIKKVSILQELRSILIDRSNFLLERDAHYLKKELSTVNNLLLNKKQLTLKDRKTITDKISVMLELLEGLFPEG